MLVLSRRPGETVRIGAEITVTVLEINGNRIRLGIEAPTQVPVLRGELDQSAVVPRAGRRCPD